MPDDKSLFSFEIDGTRRATLKALADKLGFSMSAVLRYLIDVANENKADVQNELLLAHIDESLRELRGQLDEIDKKADGIRGKP